MVSKRTFLPFAATAKGSPFWRAIPHLGADCSHSLQMLDHRPEIAKAAVQGSRINRFEDAIFRAR